jgi:ATP-binding cassette, subfamily B, bacterial
LGREDYEVERFQQVLRRLRDELIEVARIFTLYDAIQDAIPAVTTVAVLVVGAARSTPGDVSAGELATVAYLLSLIAFPLRLIGFVLWEVSGSLAGYRRVEKVLDIVEEVGYGELEPTITGGSRRLTSTDVHRSDSTRTRAGGHRTSTSDPARPWRWSGPPGQASRPWSRCSPGCGIRRRARSASTAATCDFARSALAGEVAFVGQDVFLFDDTVRGNIAFGLDVSDDEMVAAARMAAMPTSSSWNCPTVMTPGWGSGGPRCRADSASASLWRGARSQAAIADPRRRHLGGGPVGRDEHPHRAEAGGDPSTVVVVAYRRSSIALADRSSTSRTGECSAREPTTTAG